MKYSANRGEGGRVSCEGEKTQVEYLKKKYSKKFDVKFWILKLSVTFAFPKKTDGSAKNWEFFTRLRFNCISHFSSVGRAADL